MPHARRRLAALVLAVTALAGPAFPRALHQEYTRLIRELTTEKAFLTPWIETLPAGRGVPSPLEVLGHIAGAPNVLSYSHEVYKYFDALDRASARVKVFRLDKTEEGRDWIVAAIGSEEAIRNLDRYKAMTARLADPRRTPDAEAAALMAKAKPFYWATGGMHSSETGSVEMLMELAYRLAVDEGPFVKAIRDNAIVLITPILEVDGRDKYVDIAMAPRKGPKTTVTNRLLYWGKYVAHDNNRDNIGQALVLTRNILKTALDYHPQVMHDLHESAGHLYISTGSGPYNAWLDPIVIDEWHQMAYHEIDALTRAGVPGVWSHTFYDGWAPNYAFYAANGHNAIGRFYETQGAGDGTTRVVVNSTDRTWYKPNPPLAQAVWSIRNNVNLQQSALLVALHNVAVNRQRFLENFWLKGKRSVAKARAEGPAAYVLPASDPRPGLQARLLRLLQGQGIEVHKADQAFRIGETEYPAGSYVVRMDQPFSRMADMLLDKQFFNTNDGRPYDDVGWQLGPLFNVQTVRVTDVAVLAAPMSLAAGPIKPSGGLVRPAGGPPAAAYLVHHNGDNGLATLRFKLKGVRMHAAEKAFQAEGRSFGAGSFIIKPAENPSGLEAALDAAARDCGLPVIAATAVPAVPAHEMVPPRIALVHTWQSTQSEGWVRAALDELGVPYDYVSVHAVRDTARLRERWDAILIGPASGDAMSLVNGITGDKPTAWKKTPATPNIGVIDATDDLRGGLELEGVLHLRDFIREGGLLVTLSGSSVLPIHFGFAPGIAVRATPNLIAGGSVFRADVVDKASPITYGYADSVGVYFSQSPVLGLGSGLTPGGRLSSPAGRPSGRGSLQDPDVPQGRPLDLGRPAVEAFRKAQPSPAIDPRLAPSTAPRPRTILQFTPSTAELLIAGGLAGGEALAGTPALVDAPLGAGHALLFAFNPMWRHQTHGSFALVTNALLNWRDLNPPPAPPAAPPSPGPDKRS